MRPYHAVMIALLSSLVPTAVLADGNVVAPPAMNADFEAGAAAIKAQDWPGAVTRLNAALRTDPDNADVHNLLGFAYRKQGQLDPAFRHYERALKLDPRHRGAHEYIGEAYLIAGRKPQAIEHLAALEKICGRGCEEYQDLAKAIAAAP